MQRKIICTMIRTTTIEANWTIMKFFLYSFALIIVFQTAFAQRESDDPKPLFLNDPKGFKLPAALPKMVDSKGNVVWIDESFTTREYREAAFKLVLQEANRVAIELQLPEKLPIMETNLVEAFITPFGFNCLHQSIGSVTTKKYCYFISQGNKFNEVDATDYDQICGKLRGRGTLPITQLNTNSAYQLATQWLTAVSMDVGGLNRECTAHAALSPFWNGLTKLGERPQKRFAPIYFVWWTSPKNDNDGHGCVAYVELYTPTKTLLQLSVSDPRYIHRQPLLFTNLDSLLPGTAPIIKLPPAQIGAQPPPG